MAGKVGHPFHEPTEESRAVVMALVSTGNPQPGIARYLAISLPTLKKHYKTELAHGRDIVRAQITGQLIKAAMAGKPWAVCFWLKTQEGWSETVRIRPAEEDDVAIADLSDEEIAERRQRVAEVEEASTRKPYLVGGTAAKKGAA